MSYIGDADLKSFLRVQGSAHDAEVARAVDAAHAEVDRYCGWGAGGFLPASTATARVFVGDSSELRLSEGFWTTTGLTVAGDDDDDGTFELTYTAADFEVLPLNGKWGGVSGFPFWMLRLRSGLWPARVQVTARWGWAACPADVSTATLLRTMQLFQRRENREGPQVPTTWSGGHDRDWMLLLDGYRHPDKLIGFA